MAKKAKKKHPGGRPKAEKPLRTRNIRVDDETWARWGEAAAARGIKLSEWIRQAAEAAAVGD